MLYALCASLWFQPSVLSATSCAGRLWLAAVVPGGPRGHSVGQGASPRFPAVRVPAAHPARQFPRALTHDEVRLLERVAPLLAGSSFCLHAPYALGARDGSIITKLVVVFTSEARRNLQLHEGVDGPPELPKAVPGVAALAPEMVEWFLQFMAPLSTACDSIRQTLTTGGSPDVNVVVGWLRDVAGVARGSTLAQVRGNAIRDACRDFKRLHASSVLVAFIQAAGMEL